MKKIGIILVSLLMFSEAGIAADSKIKVHIAQGDGCPFGLGLCMLLLSPTSPHNIELRGTTLILNLDEKTLARDQPEVMQFFKGKSNGVFEKGFTVPAEVSKALGANGKIIVDPGKVSISYAKGVYSLELLHHINKSVTEK